MIILLIKRVTQALGTHCLFNLQQKSVKAILITVIDNRLLL